MKLIKILALSSIIWPYIFNAQAPLISRPVTPYYNMRSVSEDAARELVGSIYHLNRPNQCDAYGTFTITPQFNQTFNPQNIAASLFGTNVNQCGKITTINVTGSRTLNRGANDWLADYFYLPTDFQSSLTFEPYIQNFLIDFSLFIGFDTWVPGLFLYLHAPFNHTKWDLKFREFVQSPGVNDDDAGYFAPAAIPRASLLKNFSEFAVGRAPTDIPNAQLQDLNYAKICSGPLSKTGLADLQGVLGYNYFFGDNFHIGAGLRFACPTGSRPEANFLFEPIVGNGRHWEVGGQITAHGMYSIDQNVSAGIYFMANLTHMFKAYQRRTMDLLTKPLSRYMPVEKLGPVLENLTGQNPTDLTSTPAAAQYQQILTPLANLSTYDVRVQVNLQADVAIQGTVLYKEFEIDLGYNYWARSCERITFDCSPLNPPISPFQVNSWGLKGDAQVWGFAAADSTIAPTFDAGQPIALSATQSQATINAGTNFPITGSSSSVNGNIDSPKLAFAGGSNVILNSSPTLPAQQINTSIQPDFIDRIDFNRCGSGGSSHKVYAHLNYTFLACPSYLPYIGIGVFAEFGQRTRCEELITKCNSSRCDNCVQCSPSQWGVWLKVGATFN